MFNESNIIYINNEKVILKKHNNKSRYYKGVYDKSLRQIRYITPIKISEVAKLITEHGNK